MASGSDGDDGDGGNSASDGDSGTDEDESASESGSSEDTDGYESASDNEEGDAESDDSDFEPAGERGGGGVKRGGGTGAGQDKNKTAEKTGGRSGGNDYEEIDMEFDNDSEDDGCGPESVDAKKKKKGNRVPAFRRVIQPRKAREESDKRQIASNLEISGKKDASVKERKNDLRGLTLRQSVCALYNVIHNETLDEEIVNKLEADDPALHEIRIGVEGTMVESKGMGKGKVVACHVDKRGNKAFTIDWEKDGAADRKYSASKVLDGAIGRVDPRVHDWVEGTTVESNGLGKGRVFACGLDKAGYKEFTLNWESDGVADSKYSTFQVLDGAMEGEAESIESTIEYMTNCLCLIVCAMNTHVKAYMDSQSKRDNEPLELKKGSVAHQRAQTVRPWAWKKMLELRAHETMSRESLRLRENFHGTAEGLRNAKLYDLFHFSDSASGVNGGQVGFMDPAHYDQDFNKKQVKDMNVIVQAFQSVIRVGRPVITESILFPLTRSELPPGTLIPNNETFLAKERIEEHEAKRHGVGIKAILARAMSGSVFYHWNVHFPLYRLLLLSRPHGSIQATTESCGKVAKMRKFPNFFEESINLGKQTDSRDLDIALVKAVHKKYCDTVAPRKKRDCTRQENFKRRHARGSKYKQGRRFGRKI